MGWQMPAAVALLCGILGIALNPSRSPIDAAAYVPPRPPSLTKAPYHDPANTLRTATEFFAVGEVHGPEDIVADSKGVLYTGSESGWIQKITPPSTDGPTQASVENWVDVGGYALGLDWDAEGRLLACVQGRDGLLRVDPSGRVEVLSVEAEGVPYGLIDNVIVARDGSVYFTDATYRFKIHEYNLEFLEARPNGRLLRYDPSANRTEVVLRDLHFPNGIALSPGEDYIVFCETSRYRVRRYWLQGSRAGTLETFVDNLPGMPDNINTSPDGLFWVALFSRRPAIMDNLLHPYPMLKNIAAMLPNSVLGLVGRLSQNGQVIAIDKEGSIVQSYMDPGGMKVAHVTTAKEINGYLYVGSLLNKYIARIKLPLSGAKKEPKVA